MKWTRLKEHLLPTCMQEIDLVGDRYIKLINAMKQNKTPSILQDFFGLRSDISKRIEEIDNYFDDNMGNPKILPFTKGTINLKKLLFYNPDMNNELDEPDLEQFRALTLDMNKVQVYKGAEANKPKAVQPKNKSAVKAGGNQFKLASVKKSIEDEYTNNLGNKGGSREKDSSPNKESPVKENVNAIKKTIKVRMTDEEYRLFMRFKAKRTISIQNK